MRPCRRRPQQPPRPPRAAAWWWLVAASALVLRRRRGAARDLVGGHARDAHDDLPRARRPRRHPARPRRRRRGDRRRRGGGRGAPHRPLRLRRASGRSRQLENGTLSIVSRCPDQVLGSCRASYRLTVPDNVPLEIETSSGSVRLSGVRATVQVSTGSGAISATGFCGFLAARELRHGRRQRGQRVLGRPARAALAQRRRARGRPVRPLPDRRAERLRREPHPRAHRRRRTRRSRSRR